MKKLCFLLCTALFTATLAATALAMNHEHSGHGQPPPAAEKKSSHSGHGQTQTGMHTAQQDMVILGSVVKDGIKAVAHLNDVRAAMAQAGMEKTHHFMVVFEEAGSGKKIATATAALKITGPDQKEGKALPLVGMDGHFGADIMLGSTGRHRFTVGARLPDGKNRQFEFSHVLSARK